MAKRHELRSLYIEGWYESDIHKLLAATTSGFLFDDPAEAEPVTKQHLPDYMKRWNERAGQNQKWTLTHEVREDKDGILTDWEWWEVVDTELQGAAFVVTSEEGVCLERITYFQRNLE